MFFPLVCGAPSWNECRLPRQHCTKHRRWDGRRSKEQREQLDVTLYTIGFVDPDEDSDGIPGLLRGIARAIGGQAFFPRMSAEAVEICRRLAEALREQYSIADSASNKNFNGEYRAIKGTLTGERSHPWWRAHGNWE